MENLRIYQKALTLVKNVYELIASHERLRKDFSLHDQLKRAAISIVLNIVEGYGRGTKFYSNYLHISVGSVNEVVAALQIVQLVYKVDTRELQDSYTILAKQIVALSNSFKRPNQLTWLALTNY